MKISLYGYTSQFSEGEGSTNQFSTHICLKFVVYKIYKKPERNLKEMKSYMSPERVTEAQNIHKINLLTSNNELKTVLLYFLTNSE